MIRQVVFVTGNAEKIRDAQYVCSIYGVEVVQRSVNIDEIQHHNPQRIAEHKAIQSYKLIKQPLVINDSSWAIPALGGFPGGYMKDVTEWLSSSDFLNLMNDKTNKSINLTETNVYYDGKKMKVFSTTRYGKFGDTIRGISGPSFARVVMMEGDVITISQIFDKKERDLDPSRYAHWHEFAKWYTSKP